jgi:hypothetical protein
MGSSVGIYTYFSDRLLGVEIRWEVTEQAMFFDRLEREPPHIFPMG